MRKKQCRWVDERLWLCERVNNGMSESVFDLCACVSYEKFKASVKTNKFSQEEKLRYVCCIGHLSAAFAD